MPHKRLVALAFTAIVITTSTSCGAGAPAGPRLSRADLTVHTNAICRRIRTMLNGVVLKIGSMQEGYATLLPPVVAFEHSALAELAKFNPPSSLANDWKQLVADIRVIADSTAKTQEYAKSNNLKAIAKLTAPENRASLRVLATAERDGFYECGRAFT